MNQTKNDVSEQVEYLGTWIEKKYFRAWVYSATDQKLAKTWDQFNELIKSGLWFATKEETLAKEKEKAPIPIRTGRKVKNDSNS